MPSEVYSILVKAGYKGTEQEMYRTFAQDGVSSTTSANWNWAYNILNSSTVAGTVLTSNGAGVAPTWQAPSGGSSNSYFPSGW
jgi:hypothetical protein